MMGAKIPQPKPPRTTGATFAPKDIDAIRRTVDLCRLVGRGEVAKAVLDTFNLSEQPAIVSGAVTAL